jgi:hypothetical protein
VFDKEKMVFLEYHHVLGLFNENDFNWTEKPSSPTDKAQKSVAKYLTNVIRFDFQSHGDELKKFIKENFFIGKTCTAKAQINKNNFVSVFYKWMSEVRPTIVINPDDQKKNDLLDGDFYLADLLSRDNISLYNELQILLQESYYKVNLDKPSFLFREVHFRDGGNAHKLFWQKYERPPKDVFHPYMKQRRELLVLPKIRERKGSFFTPQIWVEKSQEYLAREFGENWQEEYYVWDCCCGTGNLLVGLSNPEHIWASTLDTPDISVIQDAVKNGESNLLRQNVFQFDFLNDDLLPQSQGGKLPNGLFKIISDPEKQKKLIIYINPPYGECGRSKGKGQKNKNGIANTNKTYKYFEETLGKALRDMATLFMARVYRDCSSGNLAVFSKLKYISAPNFRRFRQWFKAVNKSGFIIPANTFDNVNGHFPIGFLIWRFQQQKKISSIKYDAFDKKGIFIKKCQTFAHDNRKLINSWIETFRCDGELIGSLSCKLNDFQNNKMVYIATNPSGLPVGCKVLNISKENLTAASIYLTVRQLFEHTWLNDRDQFLEPNDGWQKDKKFQNACLIYTLFHPQNRIKSADGVNHWIPFRPQDVEASKPFASTFMADFISERGLPRTLSKEAKAVFEAGKVLWTYYHETIKETGFWLNDASLYEIREYFKERNENGRLNTKSADEKFNKLDKALREAVKQLAGKIQSKVYEYGFLLD